MTARIDDGTDKVSLRDVLTRVRSEVLPAWHEFRKAATPVTQADTLLCLANALTRLGNDVSNVDEAAPHRSVWAVWDAGDLRSLHATPDAARSERVRLLDRELAQALTERDVELITTSIVVAEIPLRA